VVVSSVIADRFELLPERKSGGMATVYRAKDRQTGLTVAVKLLREASDKLTSERFRHEAALLAALPPHPGIVKYIAHGLTEEGQQYLVMEWVEGETLNQRMTRTGLSAAESVALARRIAEALIEPHRQGIVHRDIKPDNLLFLRGALDGVKLIDFGIARQIADERRLTSDGGFVGTPGYTSPEQARGERQIDASADVFALGCILYECLTGRPPFLAGNLAALMTKILVSTPAPISKLRPELAADRAGPLEALVARMLAKPRAERPRDASALVAELAALPPMPATTPHPHEVEVFPTQSGQADDALSEGACLVFTTLAVDKENAAVAHTRLRALVEEQGGRLELLEDGSVVVTVQGTVERRDHVRRTAECALRMRTVLPTAPMIVTTGAIYLRPRTEDVVDRGVHTLVKSVREVIFAGRVKNAPQPDSIWIDELTAKLLGEGEQFAVERTKSGFFLKTRGG
jgi:hypothetical protein